MNHWLIIEDGEEEEEVSLCNLKKRKPKKLTMELILINKITESQLEQFAIELLEKLRDTLLPKFMSGDVRVEYENY